MYNDEIYAGIYQYKADPNLMPEPRERPRTWAGAPETWVRLTGSGGPIVLNTVVTRAGGWEEKAPSVLDLFLVGTWSMFKRVQGPAGHVTS